MIIIDLLCWTKKNKIWNKMEKVENKGEELFRHRLAKRHFSEMKEKAEILHTSFSMLYEMISSITDCNNKEYLEYFSRLYVESLPLVTGVTCYVVKNDYGGINKRFDDLIFNAQNVLKYLRVLHFRYKSLSLSPNVDHLDWCDDSEKENEEILEEMKNLLEKM